MKSSERQVIGFPDYVVNEAGEVWSKKCGRLRKIRPGLSRGNLHVTLHKDKSGHCRAVAKAVLEAFHGPCPEGMRIDFLDGDKTNTRLSNLSWGPRDGRAVKLTRRQVQRIRWAYAKNCGPVDGLANGYGVSRQTIWSVLKYLTHRPRTLEQNGKRGA